MAVAVSAKAAPFVDGCADFSYVYEGAEDFEVEEGLSVGFDEINNGFKRVEAKESSLVYEVDEGFVFELFFVKMSSMDGGCSLSFSEEADGEFSEVGESKLYKTDGGWQLYKISAPVAAAGFMKVTVFGEDAEWNPQIGLVLLREPECFAHNKWKFLNVKGDDAKGFKGGTLTVVNYFFNEGALPSEAEIGLTLYNGEAVYARINRQVDLPAGESEISSGFYIPAFKNLQLRAELTLNGGDVVVGRIQ